MIVNCSQCTARLQLDDAKVPARSFTLRCPKCQNIINVQPPASTSNQGALAVGGSPSTGNPRYEQPKAAPAFKPDSVSNIEEAEVQAYTNAPAAAESGELGQLLLELLQRGGLAKGKQDGGERPAWERRKVLLCISPAHRETAARLLASNNYQVFVASDTTQAIERMREEHMDIVILDPEFDPVEQGAAFVTREISALRTAVRRRLFFVQFSPTARTQDAHAAFIHNVNLVVNHADIENLPFALERSIRSFNELYRDFNVALKVAAI
ncbi:MAG TPA: zinc-ribbon domain-containing protein [Pyrinomonadaceae bacterium]|jgi:predicted Zn finger-like uncharacterized protein